MTLFTLAGTRVYFGTTAAASVESEFAADTYTEIKGAETLNDFGDTAADVTFTGLADSRTQHLKGASDGQPIQIQCAEISDDPGQAAVKAAAAAGNQDEYNLKVVWSNGDTSYIRGPVMGVARVNGSGPNNVMKRQFTMANNHGELVVLAA